jgi:hypothetical protein
VTGCLPTPTPTLAPSLAGALLAALAVIGTCPSEAISQDPGAQFERSVAPDGLVHLRWVLPEPPVTGQRLVARWTVVNPTGSPVLLEPDPCRVQEAPEGSTGTMALLGIQVECVAGARVLEPGDSAWVEIRGTVGAPPGARSLGAPFLSNPLELRAGDGTGVALDGSAFVAPGRIPVVLEVETGAGSAVSRERVLSLLDQAANGRGLVVSMNEAAARAQVQTSPWLRLRIGDADGDTPALEANACWHGPADGDAGCAAFRTRLPATDPEALLAAGGPLHRLLVTLLSLRDPVP